MPGIASVASSIGTVQLNLSNMMGFRVTKRLNDPIALDLDREGQNQVRGFFISFFVNSPTNLISYSLYLYLLVAT